MSAAIEPMEAATPEPQNPKATRCSLRKHDETNAEQDDHGRPHETQDASLRATHENRSAQNEGGATGIGL